MYCISIILYDHFASSNCIVMDRKCQSESIWTAHVFDIMLIDITSSPVTVKYIVFFAREHCEEESRVYYKTLLLAEFYIEPLPGYPITKRKQWAFYQIRKIAGCASCTYRDACQDRSRHSRRMRNPQFYVSGKRPKQDVHGLLLLPWIRLWTHDPEIVYIRRINAPVTTP